MIRYDKTTGHLNATNLGRVASHYYINVDTIETFTHAQTGIQSNMSESALFALMASAKEFENVKVRPDEMSEMVSRTTQAICHILGCCYFLGPSCRLVD